MTLARRGALALWIVGLVACVAVIARTRLSTDMSAFLPRSPSPVKASARRWRRSHQTAIAATTSTVMAIAKPVPTRRATAA